MKDYLAEQLLAKIMGWSVDEISKERPLLQALASFKYNDYQQFSTGIRFIESLTRWLNQFQELKEREIAYNFIKEHLIFISNEQMTYLISIAFNIGINPFIIKKTALQLQISDFLVHRILKSKEYEINLRKCLFIGLSDGSKIDFLRRSSGINNEQISTTHEISHNKADEMLRELSNAIKVDGSKFNTIFLVDDFTASGKSYFRPNESKGKIWKFLNKVFIEKDSDWRSLTDNNDLEIHILFYIATEDAIKVIQESMEDWKIQNNIPNLINIYAIQILNNTIKEKIEKDVDFIQLTEKYFDERIVDRHFKVGKYKRPNLGFNECSLPLVLSHNTPNNSLPILWLPDDMKYKGLFPRVRRHK